MSLILPSSTASTPPGKPSSNTVTRHNEQEQNEPGSFGEVLSRSLAPAAEPAEKTSGKPVTAASARRQAGDRKTDPQDLVNAMTLALAPPEGKIIPAPPTGSALAAAGNITAAGAAAGNITAAGAAAVQLTALVGSTPAPTDAALTGAALAAAGNITAAGAAAAPLTVLVESAPAPADGAALAQALKAAAPGTEAQTAPAPARAATGPKDAGQTTPQARVNAENEDSAVTLVPGKIPAQASAPDTGTSGQSSQGDDKAAYQADDRNAESTGLTPALTHRAAKVAGGPLVPGLEAAAMTVTASQAPADYLLNASAALTVTAAHAAAPVPAGVSAPAIAAAVTTPSLAPEVGSSEWGKALGQQVIRMRNAGHQVAELQLNPPGLGPLKVTLSMNDQQIQAMFVSAHSSVRAAVEAALPQLRATLADNGISLGHTSVSSDGQQQAAFAQNQNRQGDDRSYRNNRLPADTASLAPRMVTEPLRQNNGITVDTYA